MVLKIKNIKPEFIDERGYISRILDDKKVKIKSVLFIKRKKGAVGAKHYHKKDAHYIFVLKGKILYKEKNIKKTNSKIIEKILLPFDLILSSPYVAHYTEFLEDTEFIALSIVNRDSDLYENDTIRVDFFDDKC